jgi:mannose-6-phosphate isomerase
MPQAFHLDGVVQRYDWGGKLFIPELLGCAPDRQTSAELWLGIHPKGMAHLRETGAPLDEFLAAQHYTLPFLLKVLDVRASLSIQVHPDRDQAVAGFARENADGIPLDSPVRNYKDPNHKPEVMVAITPCVLLYGFSSVGEIAARCAPFASLQALQSALQARPLEAVYRQVMQATPDALDRLLAPLLREVLPRWRAGELSGEDHLFWLARAASEHGAEDCRDPGLLALLMMNLVHVAPGEAIFQPARLPHAYLHGCNVELMANSDNVLRGGLTSKHVDVDELLAVVDVHSVAPAPVRQEPVEPGLTRYRLPTDEFGLMRAQAPVLIGPALLPRLSIMLNMGADCRLRLDEGADYALKRGESLLVPAHSQVSIQGTQVDLFVAA